MGKEKCGWVILVSRVPLKSCCGAMFPVVLLLFSLLCNTSPHLTPIPLHWSGGGQIAAFAKSWVTASWLRESISQGIQLHPLGDCTFHFRNVKEQRRKACNAWRRQKWTSQMQLLYVCAESALLSAATQNSEQAEKSSVAALYRQSLQHGQRLPLWEWFKKSVALNYVASSALESQPTYWNHLLVWLPLRLPRSDCKNTLSQHASAVSTPGCSAKDTYCANTGAGNVL